MPTAAILYLQRPNRGDVARHGPPDRVRGRPGLARAAMARLVGDTIFDVGGHAWTTDIWLKHCPTPHPSPPQGEGVLFCGDWTVGFGRGMDPGSRSLRALGRGYGMLDVDRGE